MTTPAKRKKPASSKKPASPKKKKKIPDPEFKALVKSLRGSMSWLNITVDSYLEEKHKITDAENAIRGIKT